MNSSIRLFKIFAVGMLVLYACRVEAQSLNTDFEIEGNAVSAAAPGEDWDSLYYFWVNGLPLSQLNCDIHGYFVINDFGANDTTRFGEGTKDIQDIPDWAWQALPPNDKVDITNAQAALYSPGPSTFLYLTTDRFDNSGDESMGLWLLQDGTVAYNADGSWTGHHVPGVPGDTAAVDPRGDVLILAHYTNGGAVDSIAIYEWVGVGGNTDNLFGSQGSDAFDLVTKDATTAFGAVNQDTTKAPWPYLAKTGETTIFPRASFFEGALDMGVLLGNNIPHFTQFLIETRESQSLTAALKDFALAEFVTITCADTADTQAVIISPGFEIDGNAIWQSRDDWDSLYHYNPDNPPFSEPSLDFDIYTGVINDFGVNDTTRCGGGTKDIMDFALWAWQALPPSDKVDITNAQAALYRPGGSTFLYFETDRFDYIADAAIGLWLLQDSTVTYKLDGTWSGQHVAGIPGDTAIIDPRGDILILVHYRNTGVLDSIAVYEWVGSGGNTDSLFGIQGSDAFDMVPKDVTTAFGVVNQDTTKAPWPYQSKSGPYPTLMFPKASFLEGGLDLGVLFGDDIPSFTKVLFETRESQSLTAALKDFAMGTWTIYNTAPLRNPNLGSEVLSNVISHAPTFYWSFNDTDGVQSAYEIEVGSDTSWDVAELWTSGQVATADTSSTYLGDSLLDGETYYWRIRVNGGVGWTRWRTSAFHMNSVSDAPAQVSPPQNGESSTSLPTLAALASPDAEDDLQRLQFAIYLDSALIEESPLNPTLPIAAGQTVEWTGTIPLLENVLYTWTARAFDGYEYGNYGSTSRQFFVNAVNESPVASAVRAPIADSIVYGQHPTYIWTGFTDPDPFDSVSYDHRVAMDSLFAFAQPSDSLPDTSHVQVIPLETGRRYWWKVLARDSHGLTTPSAVETFRTYKPGDANGSWSVSSADIIAIVNYVFKGQPLAVPECAARCNGDASVNSSDIIWLVNFVFKGGVEPVAGCP